MLLLGCWALHVAELLLRGMLVAGAGVAALGAGFLVACRREQRLAATKARRLVVSAGGQLYLITAGGIEPASWLPSSMRLGRHLLLRLGTARGQCWALLGPDNADPAALAMLRRRISGAQAVVPTTVQSE